MNFNVEVHINLKNAEEAKAFLDKLMSHSYCTYRITRTSKKPLMKKVAYKYEMHCQHFRKGQSKRQKEMAAAASSKKNLNL